MMSLKRISGEQFRCFAKFDVKIPGPGLYQITGVNEQDSEAGANGAGKSTLLDALAFALTGKTTRGLSGPAIEPWWCDKKPALRVTLETDKHTYERKRNPNSFTMNGRSVAPGWEEEGEAFASLAVRGQFDSSFLDLTPAAKMDRLSEMLDLSVWEKLSNEASRLKSFASGRAMTLEGRVESHEHTIESKQKWLETLQADLDDESIPKKDLEASVRALKKLVDSHEAEIDKRQKKLDEAQRVGEELRESLDEMREWQQRQTSQLSVWNKEMTKVDKELTRLETFDGGACPTCYSPMDPNSPHVQKVQAEYQKRYDELKAKVEAKQSKLSKQNKDFTDTKAEYDDVKLSYHALKSEIHDKDVKLRNTRAELATRESEVAQCGQQVAEIKGKIQGVEESIAEAQKELEADKKALQKQNKLYDLAEYWRAGFMRIRLMVARDAAQSLARMITANLTALGLPGWKVHIDMERETKAGDISKKVHVTVESSATDDAVPWEVWSGGEGQRIRVACALAMADLEGAVYGNGPNVEFWDEPTAHLSVEGVERLVDTLRRRAQSCNRAVFIIDHRSLDFPFDGTLQVTKGADGIATVDWN